MTSSSPPDNETIGYIRAALIRLRLTTEQDRITVTLLPCGVSSDVWRIDRPRDKPIVCKRPLSSLRALKDWRAPIERGLYEARWLEFAGSVLGNGTLQLLGYDPEAHLLFTEYLADHRPWKQVLYSGDTDARTSASVAKMLAATHSASSRDRKLRLNFQAQRVFRSTRIDPYFDATAASHPSASHKIGLLADMVTHADTSVIHGDISPKNMLIGSLGPVILDAECACVGDPAFDAAFLLTHLCLKCLWRPQFAAGYLGCAHAFLDRYLEAADWEDRNELDTRISALLCLFLLARIDGKVPVEYISDNARREIVRSFALPRLMSAPATTRQTLSQWRAHLDATGSLTEPARCSVT